MIIAEGKFHGVIATVTPIGCIWTDRRLAAKWLGIVSPYARSPSDADRLGHSVDFDGIWREQGISPHLREGFTIAAKAVHDVIVEPPEGISNVTEWAKQQACWNRVAALTVAWPKAMIDEFISKEARRETKKAAVKDQKMLNGIDAQTAVVKAGGPLWRSLKEWGVGKRLLTPIESGILDVAASVPARIPSEKQSLRVIDTLRKLHAEGCLIGRDIV